MIIEQRRRLADQPGLLRAIVWSAPLGVIAIEAGWTVTEVGRQPWIVYKYMKTSEAVTSAHGIWGVFVFTLLLYGALGTIAVLVLISRHAAWTPVNLPASLRKPSFPGG